MINENQIISNASVRSILPNRGLIQDVPLLVINGVITPKNDL